VDRHRVGYEDTEVQSAFRGHQHDGDANNRRAEKLNDAGGIVRQMKSGKRDQVIPGRACGEW